MTLGTYLAASGPERHHFWRCECPEIFYGDPFGEDVLEKWDLGVPGCASSLFPVQVLGSTTVSLCGTHREDVRAVGGGRAVGAGREVRVKV